MTDQFEFSMPLEAGGFSEEDAEQLYEANPDAAPIWRGQLGSTFTFKPYEDWQAEGKAEVKYIDNFRVDLLFDNGDYLTLDKKVVIWEWLADQGIASSTGVELIRWDEF